MEKCLKCNKEFEKKTYHHKFCCHNCEANFWYHKNKKRFKTPRYKERIRVYFKEWRNKNRDKFVAIQERYRSKPESKEKKRLKASQQRKKWVERYKARGEITRLIKKLNLKKEGICLLCGKESRLQAHHISYKPNIAILGVCHRCHVSLHYGVESNV